MAGTSDKGAAITPETLEAALIACFSKAEVKLSLFSLFQSEFEKRDAEIATGGVSYSVGGAAAPPTLLFATPTSRLAIPYFDRFFKFYGFEVVNLTLSYPTIPVFRNSRYQNNRFYHSRAIAISHYYFLPDQLFQRSSTHGDSRFED